MQLERAAERVESLKAGILATAATAVSIFCIGALHQLLAQFLPSLQITEISWMISLKFTNLLKLASMLVSGFLFGVTYRYIVRQDNNPQLKAGAVMAFGLVRGLAQAEAILNQMQLETLNFNTLNFTALNFTGLFSQQEIWQAGIGVIESIILFAFVAGMLDWAIDRGWVKPFTTF